MNPIVQSLLLAERVYQDLKSKRFIVAGIFNSIQFSDFDSNSQKIQPGRPGSPWVYISVTEVRKSTEFQLRYVNLRNDAIIMGAKFTIDSDDPLRVHEVGFGMPMPPITEGVQELQLLVDECLLCRTRVTVVKVENSHDESD